MYLNEEKRTDSDIFWSEATFEAARKDVEGRVVGREECSDAPSELAGMVEADLLRYMQRQTVNILKQAISFLVDCLCEESPFQAAIMLADTSKSFNEKLAEESDRLIHSMACHNNPVEKRICRIGIEILKKQKYE